MMPLAKFYKSNLSFCSFRTCSLVRELTGTHIKPHCPREENNHAVSNHEAQSTSYSKVRERFEKLALDFQE